MAHMKGNMALTKGNMARRHGRRSYMEHWSLINGPVYIKINTVYVQLNKYLGLKHKRRHFNIELKFTNEHFNIVANYDLMLYQSGANSDVACHQNFYQNFFLVMAFFTLCFIQSSSLGRTLKLSMETL